MYVVFPFSVSGTIDGSHERLTYVPRAGENPCQARKSRSRATILVMQCRRLLRSVVLVL